VLAHICQSVGKMSIRLDEGKWCYLCKNGSWELLAMTAWRMHVAAGLLVDGTSDIGIVASRVGYRSEASDASC
jgi:hypothetical protein